MPPSESGFHDPTHAVTRPTAPPSSPVDTAMTEVPKSFASMMEPDRSSKRPRAVLEATLAALVVPDEGAWWKHPSGMVCSPADSTAAVSFDPRAFVAHAGAARAAGLGTHGFSRAERGRVMLGPRRAGELLELLHLDGEALVVRDRHVVAWAGRSPRRHEAPWPLELLEFAEDAVLVLGLQRPFVTYDVRGDIFELRTDTLIGWAGSFVVRAESADGHTRLEGDGTVLFLPGI